MAPLRISPPLFVQTTATSETNSPKDKPTPIVTVRSRDDLSLSPSPSRRHLSDPEAQYTSEEAYTARRNRKRCDRWSWKVWRYTSMRQRRVPVSHGVVDSKDLGIGAGEGLLGNEKGTTDEKVSKWKSRITYCTFCGISGLSIVAILLALNLALAITASLYKPNDKDAFFEKFGEPKSSLTWYPTDFTRDILPIPCHSHNDYWRRVPLYSAIFAGCVGTEADVWLYGEELFVGHNRASLTKERTFQSLYVNPLVKILENQNKQTDFYNGTSHGVFDENPGQTLTLLIDVKTSGRETWPWVLKQLEPLRQRDWLTYVENGVVHQRAVTVVGTGNTPFDYLTSNTTYRDTFFDAPLDLMWEPLSPSSNISASYDSAEGDINESILPSPSPPSINAGQGLTGITSFSEFNSTNSHYASVSFSQAVGSLWRGKISPKQLKVIRGHVRGAHRRGLRVRYWDTPGWPIGVRNHVWEVLVKEGVDILNVDDLKGASRRVW